MSKHIHIHVGVKAKDANPDGTISPDETKREEALKQRVQGFSMVVKKEAYDIGGSLRGPGIYARMLAVMSKKI